MSDRPWTLIKRYLAGRNNKVSQFWQLRLYFECFSALLYLFIMSGSTDVQWCDKCEVQLPLLIFVRWLMTAAFAFARTSVASLASMVTNSYPRVIIHYLYEPWTIIYKCWHRHREGCNWTIFYVHRERWLTPEFSSFSSLFPLCYRSHARSGILFQRHAITTNGTKKSRRLSDLAPLQMFSAGILEPLPRRVVVGSLWKIDSVGSRLCQSRKVVKVSKRNLWGPEKLRLTLS